MRVYIEAIKARQSAAARLQQLEGQVKNTPDLFRAARAIPAASATKDEVARMLAQAPDRAEMSQAIADLASATRALQTAWQALSPEDQAVLPPPS